MPSNPLSSCANTGRRDMATMGNRLMRDMP